MQNNVSYNAPVLITATTVFSLNHVDLWKILKQGTSGNCFKLLLIYKVTMLLKVPYNVYIKFISSKGFKLHKFYYLLITNL